GKEIERLIADRDTDAALSAPTIDAEGKILDGKLRVVVCGLDPGLHNQPSSCKSAIGSSNEQEPNEIAYCRRTRASSSVVTRRSRNQVPPSSNPNARAFCSRRIGDADPGNAAAMRSEEHTSELQSR